MAGYTSTVLREVRHGLVRGVLHVPASLRGDGIVLTHGAGSNCEAPLLVALGNALENEGVTVLRCDLPFRQKRPHGPPPRGSAETDQRGLREAADYIRREVSGRVFLGGHSYGGRQSTILAASQPDAAEALLLLSYPLHPPKRPTELRTAHFPGLRVPALFVHGSRDGFGSRSEMEGALKLISAGTELVEVSEAGHELFTRRNAGELPGKIVTAFLAFVEAK